MKIFVLIIISLVVILILAPGTNCATEENPYSFYLFENNEGCVRTFKSELQAVEQLKDYKILLTEYKKQLIYAMKNWHHSKSLHNPIDSYKRLVVNFYSTKKILYDNLTKLSKFKLNNRFNSTSKDYEGALNGILLLQDTYDFDVQSAVAKGTIEYMDHENQIRILKSGVKLVKSDLIDLSKVAKEKNLYDKAIMFIMEANKLMTDSEKKQYEDFNENLAHLNNKFLEKDHVLITKQRQVLPYLVKKNLQPKIVQPDWIYHQQFKTINYNPKSKDTLEKLFRIFCSRGPVMKIPELGSMKTRPKCVQFHHNDPFLKLGPFQVEIVSMQPYRSMMHNVFHEHELQWMVNFSRPQLTQLRELERSQKIFDETKGDKNKRKFIMKTIQTWFNDFDYDWSGENNHKLVYPHLLKLTRRLELATQLVIGQNKYCATEYQVTHYGLGGLCETHIDPYGYIEGAGLYESPEVQRLKQTGDIFGTLMGYLNHVEAGGATAFCEPFHEEIISPNRGSVAFWWSLDRKGHRLQETLHGGCPILKGSKWIFNKWVHYFDQWKKFPCGLRAESTFDPPLLHY